MSIVIDGLEKSFGTRKVIEKLTLEIGDQIFALLGPNGAGKTTLVNIICGLLKRDGGALKVSGYDPAIHPNEVRRRIGLSTQDTAIYNYLTAKENLDFHARIYGLPSHTIQSKVQEMLELAHLENRAGDLVGTFSGGMKRRLALARAMLHDPEILILDEPTLGIDVQNRNEIWNRILELKGKKLIFINTNYMDEADRLSDLCAIIDNGRLVALDSPENLKMNYAGGSQLKAIVEMDDKDLASLTGKLSQFSPEVKITKDSSTRKYDISLPAQKKANLLLAEVASVFNEINSIVIKDLQVRVPTLDDVFLALTGKTLRD